MLNSAKDVLRFLTFQRPPTVPHVILDGVNGVLKPGGAGCLAMELSRCCCRHEPVHAMAH